LRKVAVAIVAIPVLVSLYLAIAGRRSRAIPIALSLVVTALVVVVGAGLLTPGPTTARPPSAIGPLAPDTFTTTLETNRGLDQAVELRFAQPMNDASVAAALSIQPAAAVTSQWDATGQVLTISPIGSWQPGTYYTVTVAASALDRVGRAVGRATRGVFVTRPLTTGRLIALATVGGVATGGSRFGIAFDGPVSLSALRAALRIVPAVPGTLEAFTDGAARQELRQFVFVPSEPLAAATTYQISLDPSLDDAAGTVVERVDPLLVTVASAPTVTAFTPASGATKVGRGSAISVRFSEPMDQSATRPALHVTSNGHTVAGRATRAAGGSTLTFQPPTALAYGAAGRASVTVAATSLKGLPLAKTATASFTIAPKPAPKPAPKRTTSTPISRPPATSGSWYAVELYYLKLMNCTRTGGWVTSTGACSSPGGRNVAPLKLDAGISSKVSRPYAKYLATIGVCSHFADGTPGDRLRRAGYTNWDWAENLGCQGGNPYAAVLATHLFFQSEKSYNGGHYVNMMNALYDRVGIGIWVYAGRLRLVIDFYHP
jgi:uncharacterized protein YkwD